ncbi:K-box region and MADS-box transcription factor family protein [Actinidia rufa]|uniref:K-box region and MADS-box transcription factor family protein n=1 Tax=Actinidia rufa TaxID=165716 RepID=A0A7J0EIA5_9ERIC|nr:K-box region and MADS-box transcription factor family protein [Actinidia rufa]
MHPTSGALGLAECGVHPLFLTNSNAPPHGGVHLECNIKGKIQIKRIENSTNRQVTYSKRRNGLFKKANELTVLCDAKVSIIMLSSTGKLHEYISPSVATKQLFDQYQKTLGIDLWSPRYEKMQEHLKKLKHVNRNLRREIRQRMGESLNNELSYEDLHCLELDMETSLNIIRDRKDAIGEDSHYGLVDNEGDYDSVLAYSNGDHGILALRLQPNHHSLHAGAGLDLTTYALLE